jgi:hypothetical protein
MIHFSRMSNLYGLYNFEHAEILTAETSVPDHRLFKAETVIDIFEGELLHFLTKFRQNLSKYEEKPRVLRSTDEFILSV